MNQKDQVEKIHKSFDNNAYIILIKNGKTILSGILLICTKDTAYYMYAASTSVGKKLYAPTLNTWEAIRLAKKLKKKYFDFEGIYDDRFPIKSWLGFTRFKMSFGGKEVSYPGAYQKFILSFMI